MLLKKLGNPQDKIKAISIVGTNGKYSTINAIFSILKESKLKCNAYTSPHINKINERFIFNNNELGDGDLANLFQEVEEINNNKSITLFEILTACYFYKAAEYPDNINLVEAGLFHRFDATNVLKENLASVICSCSIDHTDWLPKNERTIKKIIFEKTSALLNSNIIVAKQRNNQTMNYIKDTIAQNSSNKVFFGDDYSYSINKDDFFVYEDSLSKLKLPMPNVLGQFQLENISTAIATIKTLNISIKNEDIQKGVARISSLGRLQEIKSGKWKELVKYNKLLIDGSHNEEGARVLNKYLQNLDCRKHVVIGMMANKQHEKYISYFKNISSVTVVDIPNQPNSINGIELKKKFKNFKNVRYETNILKAIKSINLRKGDILLVTGSLYLAGEVLNLN